MAFITNQNKGGAGRWRVRRDLVLMVRRLRFCWPDASPREVGAKVAKVKDVVAIAQVAP